MILLTVGTQLPFDRFVEIVDRHAPRLPDRIFAQIGRGSYVPANMDWKPFIGPIEFEERIRTCSLIISHAGIGTIVMAQKHAKPMILFPRRAALDEHRNDHQLATVQALGDRQGIRTAMTEDELVAQMAGPHSLPVLGPDLPGRDRLRRTVSDLVRDVLQAPGSGQ
ncbi:glycosyltransferase [Novosphingobium aquimarinum]|uniref:glycosyltransferase n=1 Tax=Novosphingobium aquimarinum TaxID=2682494 RepID=UPI0018DB3872|nr:glycosyltransferase [Novosphingobium aquimarinum]